MVIASRTAGRYHASVMLRELKITNLVLIDRLDIALGPGLTVLTGETGAGKSIILQAIHLLAGESGGQDQVRANAAEAVVEALFELDAGQESLLADIRARGVEVEDCLVIKRVIPAAGKSRFYINGSFATAALAGELLENLLALASQHEHQQLLAPRAHLEFLDNAGGHGPLRTAYAELYERWHALRLLLTELEAKEKDKEQRRDFLSFQCREIVAAGPAPDEDEKLTSERERIKAACDLERLGREALFLLRGAVADNLAMARKNAEKMAEFDSGLTKVAKRLVGAGYELEDLSAELVNYLGEIPTDPARLEELSARLDLIQNLKRKYGPSLDEVIAFGQRAQAELEQLADMEARLMEGRAELARLDELVLDRASELSRARHATALEITARLQAEFDALCLAGARFEVRFAGAPEPELAVLNRRGGDRPEFFFSANPGEPLRPLAGVASGGELSRLMLGLRCILAHDDQVATVLFDEVDAGISGRTAEAVAAKLQELAGHHQVICITHLPQIAARANEHFQVEKTVADDRTTTAMRPLANEDRVRVLAGMLDGDSVSGKTMDYAQELLARHQTR